MQLNTPSHNHLYALIGGYAFVPQHRLRPSELTHPLAHPEDCVALDFVPSSLALTRASLTFPLSAQLTRFDLEKCACAV